VSATSSLVIRLKNAAWTLERFEPIEPSNLYNLQMEFGRRTRKDLWVRVAAALTLVLFLVFVILRRGRLW
jgi:hypothetical protein